MTSRFGVLAALAALVAAGPAFATTVTETFAFTGYGGGVGGPFGSEVFTSDKGNKVTVTAATYDDYIRGPEFAEGLGDPPKGTVVELGFGIGVYSAITPCCPDSNLVDGNGRKDDYADGDYAEALVFRFFRPVTIEEIVFSGFDATAPEGTSFDLALRDRDLIDLSFGADGRYVPSSLLTSDKVGLGAWLCLTGWAVAEIRVSYEDTTPVPLPAGAPLLLGGLAGFGLLGWRRRAPRRPEPDSPRRRPGIVDPA